MCFEKNHPYKQLHTSLKHQNQEHFYFDVSRLDPHSYEKLPFCLRVLLETTVRHGNHPSIDPTHIEQILSWPDKNSQPSEFPFLPSRVIMHEFSGLPAIIDLATMRDAAVSFGCDPALIQPKISTTLLLDCYNIDADVARKIVRKTTDNNTSTTLDCGYELCPFHKEKTICAEAIGKHQQLEFERNSEKLQILKWSGAAFDRLSIFPPGTGVCQQLNLEYLAQLMISEKGCQCIYPDTLIGTDTHTTISNGFGVLSYNMGTIEAEVAMFGQPISIRLSSMIIGCRLIGEPHFMSTAVDLISALMKFLRQIGIVNGYVEFFGSGLKFLTVADRSSIAHLCVEQGALLAYFPWDESCLEHFARIGRDLELIDRMKNYFVAAKLFSNDEEHKKIVYTAVHEFDLSTVTPSCSGPKRTQDKVSLSLMKGDFQQCLTAPHGFRGYDISSDQLTKTVSINDDESIRHGSITLATITGVTNSISHANSLLVTGLIARNALLHGLRIPTFTQTCFSPGSGIVTAYLRESGTLKSLEDLGFRVTGYGCGACDKNEEKFDFQSNLRQLIDENEIINVGLVTGSRQNQQKHTPNKANYVTSAPLVLAYALAGNIQVDLEHDEIQSGETSIPISGLWPSRKQVEEIEDGFIMKKIFQQMEDYVQLGNSQWNSLSKPTNEVHQQYSWTESSTYIRRSPFFDSMVKANELSKTILITNARVLLYLGDSVSTDHISPAGSISRTSPAAKYLTEKGAVPRDFQSFGSRRGDHQVMVRGTFNHSRLNNKLVQKRATSLVPNSQPSPPTTTIHFPSKLELDVFDASEIYLFTKTPLIILAGKNYGCGPSRDWVAKGPWMLGVRAILAESFETQHRSNLIGMGILPLQFQQGQSCASLNLNGREIYSIEYDLGNVDKEAIVQLDDGRKISMIALVETEIERLYMFHGGFLPYVLRNMIDEK